MSATPAFFLLNPKEEAFAQALTPYSAAWNGDCFPGKDTKQNIGCILIFTLISLLLFSFLAWISMKVRLDIWGQHAEAQVSSIQACCQVQFSYKTSDPDGKAVPHVASIPISEEEFKRLESGKWVTLDYFPGNYALIRINGSASPLLNFIWPDKANDIKDGFVDSFALFAYGIGVGGAFMLGGLLVQYAANLVITHFGRIVPGCIVFCQGQVKQNKDDDGKFTGEYYVVTMRYAFLSPSGRSMRGTSKYTRNDLRGTKLPGANVPMFVLYFNEFLYFGL